MTFLHPRSLLAVLALAAVLPPAVADEADFGGVWVGWLCPEGVSRDSGKCSNFVLELHQRNGRLCGAHTVSTAGATQVDEGGAPSVRGDIADGVATVTVTSTFGRAPVPVRGELKRAGAALQWKRLDAASGQDLLPKGARLSKSKKKSLFAPLFEQELQAVCLSAFTIAEQSAASQAQPAVQAPAR